jgi:hypothetical protein
MVVQKPKTTHQPIILSMFAIKPDNSLILWILVFVHDDLSVFCSSSSQSARGRKSLWAALLYVTGCVINFYRGAVGVARWYNVITVLVLVGGCEAVQSNVYQPV